jgi:hypothetical protein
MGNRDFATEIRRLKKTYNPGPGLLVKTIRRVLKFKRAGGIKNGLSTGDIVEAALLVEVEESTGILKRVDKLLMRRIKDIKTLTGFERITPKKMLGKHFPDLHQHHDKIESIISNEGKFKIDLAMAVLGTTDELDVSEVCRRLNISRTSIYKRRNKSE